VAAPKQPTPNEVLLLDQRLKQNQESTYPDLPVQDYFLIDSVDTILRRKGLSNRQIEDGIVDGADDGGIDAVYLFVDGQLVEDAADTFPRDNIEIDLEVIQAKHESGFKEVPLQLLLDHLPLLLSLDSSALNAMEFNSRVIERFELFRLTYLATSFPKLRVNIRYATKAHDGPNEKVRIKAGRLEAKIAQMFSSARVAVDFLGAKELNNLARQRKSAASTLRVSEGPMSAEKGGLVCLVSLHDYFDFITDDDGRLRDEIFEENVRDYEGATVINRAIASTLRQGDGAPIDFWWLNNGVTVIGNRVGATGKRLELEDPQVVNGLQSSKEVYSYFQSLPGGAQGNPEGRGRQVLVRVIETTDEEIAAQVIKATNSQNRVSAASLRSAEPFQRSIEEYFLGQGLYYERKRNHYKNLRKPRAKTVEIPELAQAVGAILLQEPHVARGTPSALVRDPRYGRVFNQKAPLAAFYKCFLIMQAVDAFLKNQDDVSSRHERSNIRFHFARAISALALASSRPKPNAIASLDLRVFDDEKFLRTVLDWTIKQRAEAAKVTGVTDPGNLAKQSEWANQIDAVLSKYSAKQSWPKRLVHPSVADRARVRSASKPSAVPVD
jgi:hypothetical protein